MQRSHFDIRVGGISAFRAQTILVSFTAPATFFRVPVPCGIHIPIFMWHNGVTQMRGPEFLGDNREPGFQIGVWEVRQAILSHLLARWRVLHERIPQPPRTSLFGQVLVRMYVSARFIVPTRGTILNRTTKQATFVVEKLRYLIFEVPKENWDLSVGVLSPIRTVRWNGSMGRFSVSFNGSIVFLHFLLPLTRPVHRSIRWKTAMSPWEPQDIDNVRDEVVARIFLEADPHIQL